MTEQVIYISKPAYIYLNEESRKQRGCGPLSDKAYTKLWARVHKENDLAEVTDSTFGGGDGTMNYHNWTRWKVDTLKGMLKAKGYSWVDGTPIEVINM